MNVRVIGWVSAIGLAASVLCLVPASARAQAKAGNDKKTVPIGYGLDKDQPFAGADPNGTGLPWKEPPAAEVEAAKKAPTPHLADGHPDLTGFWAPAGWGYAVTQGAVSADGKTRYTQPEVRVRPNQPTKSASWRIDWRVRIFRHTSLSSSRK